MRSPRARLRYVGEESGLLVLTVMVHSDGAVSLERDVSPRGGCSTDGLSLSPKEQVNCAHIPGNGLGLKIRGFMLLLPPACY